MRLPLTRLLLLLPLVLATGCQSSSPSTAAQPSAQPAVTAKAHSSGAHPAPSRAVNKAFYLTQAQIRSLAMLADQGNTAAAERLGDYYAMVVLDTPRAIACYKVGAQHGSARCRHNMEELQREDAQFAHKG